MIVCLHCNQPVSFSMMYDSGFEHTKTGKEFCNTDGTGPTVFAIHSNAVRILNDED